MLSSPTPTHEIREFVAYLRSNGFVIGLSEFKAMVSTIQLAGIEDSKRIEKCWRCLAASSHQQWEQFPSLFESFWFPKKMKGSTKSSGQKKKGKSLPELIQEIKGDSESSKPGNSGRTVGLGSAENEMNSSDDEKGQGGASRVEPLAEKPLGDWLPQDSQQLDSLIAPLQARLKRKLLRHYRHNPQARRLDLRESIRKASSTAGELICLRMKERKTIPPKIFILVDVSKSMESHAQFFLRMARSFCQVLNARVFVFHTSLIEVSALMKRDSGRVQEKINAVAFGFGGGTRIATNLQSFVQQSKLGPSGNRIKGIGKRDIVYVLSDGYDTDPPQKTLEAISAIRKKGAELFWLHPTIGQPQSEAIQMSKEAISGFMAVSHLNSLNGLVDLTLKHKNQPTRTKMEMEL
ncbi:vWA domain-containing protein [Polynucleobacter asymbioticus]|jgi:uncharacterized protein with von Willebrand factor type A (vWA) domain|nr:VWA domain-containing protein [Polynucleobacter asymbioticus]